MSITVSKCHRCFREWDIYESDIKYQLRKCSVCHATMCKSCFYTPNSKQHCLSCWLNNTPKKDNKCVCITNRQVHHYIYK